MKAFTFWPVSVVIAKPLGTSPAVLCFFTSLTETTGIATWMEKTTFIKETVKFDEANLMNYNEKIIGKINHQCDLSKWWQGRHCHTLRKTP